MNINDLKLTDLDPRLTIFIGENGSGKSYILNKLRKENPHLEFRDGLSEIEIASDNEDIKAIRDIIQSIIPSSSVLVSEGIIKVSSMFTNNLANMNFNRNREGLICIDNIDAFLHPTVQRVIISKLLLAFPNAQFVVSTNSPLILSSVYSKHIRSIENGEVLSVTDTFGHDNADDMLRIMGVISKTKEDIKTIHRLLKANNIEAAKAVRKSIVTEGTFAPLSEIDLLIKRKETQKRYNDIVKVVSAVKGDEKPKSIKFNW